jgi:hypothetical protein
MFNINKRNVVFISSVIVGSLYIFIYYIKNNQRIIKEPPKEYYKLVTPELVIPELVIPELVIPELVIPELFIEIPRTLETNIEDINETDDLLQFINETDLNSDSDDPIMIMVKASNIH